jgi:hypothetical protein
MASSSYKVVGEKSFSDLFKVIIRSSVYLSLASAIPYDLKTFKRINPKLCHEYL